MGNLCRKYKGNIALFIACLLVITSVNWPVSGSWVFAAGQNSVTGGDILGVDSESSITDDDITGGDTSGGDVSGGDVSSGDVSTGDVSNPDATKPVFDTVLTVGSESVKQDKVLNIADYEQGVSLKLTISDDVGGSGLSHLIYNHGDDEVKTISLKKDQEKVTATTEEIVINKPDQSGTTVINIKVYDVAGNYEENTFPVVSDVIAPSVSCSDGNQWHKEKVKLQPVLTDDGSEEITFYYEIYKKNNPSENPVPEKTGNAIADSKGNVFVEIGEDGYWTVKMHAKDKAGNESEPLEVEVKIDSRAPLGKAYMEYKVDENSKFPIKIDDKPSYIAKDKIQLKLYLQDDYHYHGLYKKTDYSDIASMEVEFNGKKQTVIPDSESVALKENKEFTEEEIETAKLEDIYRIFDLTLDANFGKTSKALKEIVSEVRIISITDHAGNTFQESIAPTFVGGSETVFWIIDSVAPVLEEVEYRGIDGKLVDDIFYFTGKGEVKVSIKERYFENGVEPKVELHTDGSWKEVSNLEWEEGLGPNTYTTSISIPETEPHHNLETEYRVRVTYEDIVGNKLVSEKEEYNIEGDSFISKLMVRDQKAPNLHDFSIISTDDNNSPITLIDGLYYVKNLENEDINITFTLEDAYFSKDNVTIHVWKDGVLQTDAQIGSIIYQQEDNDHVVSSFGFDSGTSPSGTYAFEVIYADHVGNKMVLADDAEFSKAGITAGKMEDGSYRINSHLVLDGMAPTLNSLAFNTPFQYANDLITQENIQDGNTRLYYNEDIQVTFDITDRFLNRENIKIRLYKNGTECLEPTIHDVNGELGFTIKAEQDASADGEYYFTLSYINNAGTQIEQGEEVCDAFYENSIKENTYTSPILVMDTKAPVIQVTYTEEKVNSLGEIDFYNTPYAAEITIEEVNFRSQELTDWVNTGETGEYGISLGTWSFNENGEKEYKSLEDIIGTENVKAYQPSVNPQGKYSLTIPIDQEGNHEIGISYIDMAGNEAIIPVKQTVLDTTRPEIEVSYEIENIGFLDFIKYGDLGFIFAQKKIIVTAEFKDQVSGVSGFQSYVDGEPHNSKQYDKQEYSKTITNAIPLKGKDFDGNYKMVVEDWSNHVVEHNRKYLVESEETHESSSEASVTILTQPSRQVDGVNYYNATINDIYFTVNAREDFAGLSFVEIAPKEGCFQMETNAMPDVKANQEVTDNIYTWNVKEIAKSFTHSGYFQINDTNDKNGLGIDVLAMSNTGYSRTASSETFVLDKTLPTVSVEFYDTPVNDENCYNQARTATITFTERNFSSEDIKWNITNTEGTLPAISGFTNDNSTGDDNNLQHTGTVTFSEDGNYTFSFTFMDKAGNEVEYTAEPFTVDVTAPVLEEVVYLTSGSSKVGDIYYYGEETNITLSLKERYFHRGTDPKVALETNGSWTELNDLQWKASDTAIYKTSIPLTKVGDNEETKYRIRVTYEDFVGNKMSSKDSSNVVEDGVFTSNIMVVDDKAPILHKFWIEPTDHNASSIQLIDGLYYVKNQEIADLNVRFTIEDYYFSESNVTINVWRDGKVQKDAQIHNLTYKRDEANSNLMTGSFAFDSTDNHVGSYFFEIIYTDYSGNKMVLAEDEIFSKNGVTTGKMQNGSYQMEHKIVMDSQAPILRNVTFNAPYQYANNFVTQNGIQNGKTQLYYNKDIQVTFQITDEFFDHKDVEVKLYKKDAHYHSFDTSKFMTPALTYQNGQLSFNIKTAKDSSTDGEYYFTVSYKDHSGNQLELGTQTCDAFYKDSFVSHTYTSPILVMDTKAPVVQVSYKGEIVNRLNQIDFYNAPYIAEITIKERNFRAKELTDWVNTRGTGQYGISLGTWTFNTNGEREYKKLEDIVGTANIKAYQPKVNTDDRYSLSIPINQEGNHELGVTYIDMAGNKAQVVPVKQTVYDKTRPEMEVSYQVEDSKFTDFIKYGDLGFFFSQKKVTITAQVKDNVAGVKELTHTVTGKNKQGEPTNKQSYTYTFKTTLPLTQKEQDYDGMIDMQVQDWSNNTEQQRQNHIVETQGTYHTSSSANITINTAASREVDGIKYYNSTIGNIIFTVNAAEQYAGLRSVQVAPRNGSFDMGTNAMPAIEAKQEMSGVYQWNVTNAIVKNFSHTGSFKASESNNKNGLQVELSALSNAGYTKTAVSEAFSIDTTPPSVEVTFNDIPVYNNSFYGETRVATVTFKERNFWSNDIEWNITNSDGELPVISGFSNDNSSENDNELLHIGTVTFSEDGDYTFAFSFMDKAGNRIEYEAEPFTIDCTAPIVEITYDNNNGANSDYFRDARTANIKITEHNFKESDVKATIGATNNGVAVAAPNISSFRSEGDYHYATISCNNDSEITFDIAYTDNAGNEAVAVESQSFVIDLSDPEITIDQVVDSSANKGTVAPVIEVTDTNFDANTVDITLSGARCGVVNYENTQTPIPNGRRIAYADFAYDASVDDIYTLKVSVADKAGRISEQEIIFSVNRFGSTYQFSESTKNILDRYYINENETMVITETNVDTLEFQEIYLLVDGEKRNLSQGTDYTVEETGNQEKWKQYIYTLDKHNFEEEGSYKIIIYSQDKAENESDNRIKDTNIEFIVDKTAPILTIAGIEDDKQYVLEERLVTIHVKDNVELDNMTVYLNSDVEKYGNYTTEQIQDTGGVVSIHVGSSNSRQYLTVSAVDKAGNENQAGVEKFLISSDLFVQFYRNTPLFLGSIATVGLTIVGTSYALLFRKRKKL